MSIHLNMEWQVSIDHNSCIALNGDVGFCKRVWSYYIALWISQHWIMYHINSLLCSMLLSICQVTNLTFTICIYFSQASRSKSKMVIIMIMLLRALEPWIENHKWWCTWMKNILCFVITWIVKLCEFRKFRNHSYYIVLYFVSLSK